MTLHSISNVRRAGGAMIIVLALIGPSVYCKNLKTESRWAEGKISIDGRSKDWQSVQGVFLSEQNAAFTFNNDGEYLYVLFRTTDQGWARTIKTTGLTFYFDVTGGKKKDASICFKGGPTMEQAMAMRPRNAGASEMPTPPGGGQGPRGTMNNQAPTLTCTFKDRPKEKAVPVDGSAGPAAAFDTCQGFFTYEFRIPLTAGEGEQYGLGAEPGQAISVGGVWGDMGEMAQGGPGGGMGGPGGGRGGGGERPKTPEKQEVWIKTTTAIPQTVPGGDDK